MHESPAKRPLWVFPWNYRESFLIAFGLFLVALALQYSTRASIKPVAAPVNYFLGALFLLLIILLHFLFRTNPVVKWLRSVPAAVSSISLLLLLAVIMGVLPQDGEQNGALGFNSMLSSWPFLLSQIYFLLCLGLCTIARMVPWKWKNWGFILNHLGLFLAMFAGMLGSGDLQRYTMDLYKGKPEWRARDSKDTMVEMPFAFDLQEFQMETYAPKLAVADVINNTIEEKGTNALRMLAKGDAYTFNKLSIQVLDYIENSKYTGVKYAPVNELGAVPAALLRVRSFDSAIDTTGWISCGSFNTSYAVLQINTKQAVVMLRPEAKRFRTLVNVYYKEKQSEKAVIEVNHPYQAGSWKVYQLSYDEKYGKYSPKSVIELVRDPWLPVVYTGIVMMVIGSIYLLFKGSKRTSANNKQLTADLRQ